jgi:hypothetical protein
MGEQAQCNVGLVLAVKVSGGLRESLPKAPKINYSTVLVNRLSFSFSVIRIISGVLDYIKIPGKP